MGVDRVENFMSAEMQKTLTKQPHFWISLSMVILGAVQASGVVPPGKIMQLTIALQTVMGWIGYQLGAVWSPPRRPWTDEERAKHGLPPADATTKAPL